MSTLEDYTDHSWWKIILGLFFVAFLGNACHPATHWDGPEPPNMCAVDGRWEQC